MDYVLTSLEMKTCDANTMAYYQVPSCVLMERAALASVMVFDEEKFDSGKVLILCGSGNNGGDGLAVARLLHLKGIHVEVCFVGKEASCTKETGRQLEICRKYKISLITNPDFSEYTSIVDAIFGIGLSREVEGKYRDIIEKANHAPAQILALDIPSGLHADTGQVMGTAIKAEVTVTFAFCKRGLLISGGKEFAGKVRIKDIGITPESFRGNIPYGFTYDRDDVCKLLPVRPEYSNKGTFGKVLVIAGSRDMPGAALLSAKAAYQSGAGLVRIFSEEANRQILHMGIPEAIVNTYEKGEGLEKLEELADWPDVAAIGPGLGQKPDKKGLVSFALEHLKIPLVLDADALNILSASPEWLRKCSGRVIVTPHVGEMARLMGCAKEQVLADLCKAAYSFAKDFHVICVLKDAGTVVSDGKKVYINQSGNSGMATGGSGDVLTGIIAGLIAQGTEPFQAACAAVFLHGLAGDAAKEKKGTYSMLAQDIIEGLTCVMRQDKRR